MEVFRLRSNRLVKPVTAAILSAGVVLMLSPAAMSKPPSTAKTARRALSSLKGPSHEVQELIAASRCSTQASELVKKWGATEKWIRSPGDMDGGKIFSSPTSRVGVWVQLAFYPNKSVEALRVSRESSIWVTWNVESCVPSMKPRVFERNDGAEQAQLRDSDLQKIVDAKGAALIYAWSPHMPLSVKGFPEAQQTAQKLKLAFVPVLDPEADIDFAKETAAKHLLSPEALKRDATLELGMRGMHIHFPTSLVISNGNISGLYPGLWVNTTAYEAFVKGNLE